MPWISDWLRYGLDSRRESRRSGGPGSLRHGRTTSRPDQQQNAMPRAAASATAAKPAGIDLKVRSGYRTYAEQAVLYDRYVHGRGALAARPGHSTHGQGLSADIDVSDPRTLAWLRKHAARFGFVADVPSENWHWTYRPR